MAHLYDIRDFSQIVSLSISSILGIEVLIIDEKLKLISGIGIYENRLFEYYENCLVISNVIRHKRPIIIEQANKHEICLQCGFYSSCIDLAKICYPILLEEKCIGVIALTANTKEQKQRLLSNIGNLDTFIKNAAYMLTYVIENSECNKQVSSHIDIQRIIMNSIQEGIISLDSDNRILYANQSAAVLLNTCQEDLPLKPINQIFQSFQSVLDDIKLGMTLDIELIPFPYISLSHFIGTISHIDLPDDKNGLLICFRDIQTVPRVLQVFSRKERKLVFDDILGESPALIQIKKRAFWAARSSSSILITGESGTGKEMFARAIHYASPRSSGPFICINCGAIPETILESELFGYEEGSFTGAKKGGKPGQFELAHNGTLFLDEIGEMPFHLQVKLLRALEEKQIQRIGGAKLIFLNIRIIAATNKNLLELVNAGKFRNDLYYRLNVIPLNIPPLVERLEDLKIYIEFFIERYNKALNNKVTKISADALDVLMEYNWPGNIRELENVIEYAINFETETKINVLSLPDYLILSTRKPAALSSIQENEKRLIIDTLHKFNSRPRSIDQAAGSLGMSRATLYRKIKQYDIKNLL